MKTKIGMMSKEETKDDTFSSRYGQGPVTLMKVVIEENESSESQLNGSVEQQHLHHMQKNSKRRISNKSA